MDVWFKIGLSLPRALFTTHAVGVGVMTSSPGSKPALDVSVVICTKNRPHLISGAVRSVLDNRYPSFELLVVDQSTDCATQQALTPFPSDRRLRIIHSRTTGLAVSRNL